MQLVINCVELMPPKKVLQGVPPPPPPPPPPPMAVVKPKVLKAAKSLTTGRVQVDTGEQLKGGVKGMRAKLDVQRGGGGGKVTVRRASMDGIKVDKAGAAGALNAMFGQRLAGGGGLPVQRGDPTKEEFLKALEGIDSSFGSIEIDSKLFDKVKLNNKGESIVLELDVEKMKTMSDGEKRNYLLKVYMYAKELYDNLTKDSFAILDPKYLARKKNKKRLELLEKMKKEEPDLDPEIYSKAKKELEKLIKSGRELRGKAMAIFDSMPLIINISEIVSTSGKKGKDGKWIIEEGKGTIFKEHTPDIEAQVAKERAEAVRKAELVSPFVIAINELMTQLEKHPAFRTEVVSMQEYEELKAKEREYNKLVDRNEELEEEIRKLEEEIRKLTILASDPKADGKSVERISNLLKEAVKQAGISKAEAGVSKAQLEKERKNLPSQEKLATAATKASGIFSRGGGKVPVTGIVPVHEKSTIVYKTVEGKKVKGGLDSGAGPGTSGPSRTERAADAHATAVRDKAGGRKGGGNMPELK